MKAFQVQVRGFDLAIVAAESRAKAKSHMIKTLCELDYARSWKEAIENIEFCRRSPEHDSWASQQAKSRSISTDYFDGVKG